MYAWGASHAVGVEETVLWLDELSLPVAEGVVVHGIGGEKEGLVEEAFYGSPFDPRLAGRGVVEPSGGVRDLEDGYGVSDRDLERSDAEVGPDLLEEGERGVEYAALVGEREHGDVLEGMSEVVLCEGA